MGDSQPEVDDYVPQSAFQTVKPENGLVPPPPDTEQQCRQLQDFRMCRTSESRQPPLLCSLSAVSSTCMLPQKPPEFPAFPPRVVASDGRCPVAAAGGLLSVCSCECYEHSQPL